MVSDLKSLHKLYYARLHETRVKTSKNLLIAQAFLKLLKPDSPEALPNWAVIISLLKNVSKWKYL